MTRVSSSIGMPAGAVAAMRMIASASVSAFTICGGSASSGMLRRPPTASRRSFAASFRSVDGSNSTVTRLCPERLCEEIETMPGVRAIALSTGAVISLSIVSGAAPV